MRKVHPRVLPRGVPAGVYVPQLVFPQRLIFIFGQREPGPIPSFMRNARLRDEVFGRIARGRVRLILGVRSTAPTWSGTGPTVGENRARRQRHVPRDKCTTQMEAIGG